MNKLLWELIKSWNCIDGQENSTSEIVNWISVRNREVQVEMNKISLENCKNWLYDNEQGCIRSENNSFFRIMGIMESSCGEVTCEQPIILQNEIGYLGIVCKKVNGMLHFLMQAKIEPGNINKIQISPTIQATKSNFTQKHGGKKPEYLNYFVYSKRHTIVVDQLQSEQSLRFYKKRNRNIIVLTEDEIEVLPSHRWMTLGQIKQLMKVDNLVNMDTRTVLSCIPYSLYSLDDGERQMLADMFSDTALYCSIFEGSKDVLLPNIFSYINDRKMFDKTATKLVPIYSLKDWHMTDNEFVKDERYPFKVVFYDIAIEGREVTRWSQPLFEAIGMATFGLFTCVHHGIRKFLVHALHEAGSFDGLELAPSVQLEEGNRKSSEDYVTELFCKIQKKFPERIKYSVILSEEGGRFYQEQNYNVILEVGFEELSALPEGYFWADYRSLNLLVQVNNCLNIQLRNLLSLLEV